jgi:hypothetical protein
MSLSRRLFSTLVGPRSSLVAPVRAAALNRWIPPAKGTKDTFGDYPDMPYVPFDNRDVYAHWDDPLRRRNFGETVRIFDKSYYGAEWRRFPKSLTFKTVGFPATTAIPLRS